MRETSSLQSIQVNPEDFDLSENEIIGSGTFATVYRGKLFGMEVAVKAFKGSGFGDKVKFLLLLQVDLVICGLFIYKFANLRLKIDHFSGTYLQIYCHS
jgi:hypothetical protein